MAGWSGKVREQLEWLHHGRLLVEIVAALGGGTFLRAALLGWSRIPSVWVTPIWLFASAAFLAIMIWVFNRRKPQQVSAAASAQLVAPAPVPPPIDAEGFLHAAYCGQLQQTVEADVRATITSHAPVEREEFCVRLIATGLINFLYERIWLLIFRSQLLALHELNRRVMRREELQPFYEAAVPTNPQFYAHYSLDQWISFLQVQGLLLQHPGNVFEITVRGKDFLKYVVHMGYRTEDRKF